MHFNIYIPAGIIGIILVVMLLLLANAGLHLFERWRKKKDWPYDNEAAGIIFGVLALIYSLLIAFIFVAVWENYEELNRTIEQEADELTSVLVHSALLPDSLQVPVQGAVKSYCEKVVREEWDMAEGGDHSQGSAIPALRLLLFEVNAETKSQENVLSVIDANLSNITNLRRQRLSHTRAHVPQLVWMILIISTVIVILFSYFLQVQSDQMKRIFLSFLWIMIGMSLFMVYMLDHPFAGSTQVSKMPYEEIIKQLTKGDAS